MECIDMSIEKAFSWEMSCFDNGLAYLLELSRIRVRLTEGLEERPLGDFYWSRLSDNTIVLENHRRGVPKLGQKKMV